MVFLKIMLMSFGLMFLLNEGYASQKSQKQSTSTGGRNSGQTVVSGNSSQSGNGNGLAQSAVPAVDEQGNSMQQDQIQDPQSVQPSSQQKQKGKRGATVANTDIGQSQTSQMQPVAVQNRQQQGMQSVNLRNGQTPISGTVGAVAVIPAPFLQSEDCNKCTRENCISKQEGTEEADQARRNALICAEYCLHAPLKLFGCVSSAYKHFCKKQPKAVQQAGDCKKLMVASNEILQVVLENKDNLSSKLDTPYKGSTSYRDLAITQLGQAIKKPAVDPKDPQNGNLTKLLEVIKLGKTNKNSEKDKGALHGLTIAQRNLPEVLSASSREAKIFATFVSLVNDMTVDVAPLGIVPQPSGGMFGRKAVTPAVQQQQGMPMQNPQVTAAHAKANVKAGAQNRMASSMNVATGGMVTGDNGQG